VTTGRPSAGLLASVLLTVSVLLMVLGIVTWVSAPPDSETSFVGAVYVGLGLVVGLLALVTWTLRQRDS
jgi:hypothetical protein